VAIAVPQRQARDAFVVKSPTATMTARDLTGQRTGPNIRLLSLPPQWRPNQTKQSTNQKQAHYVNTVEKTSRRVAAEKA